ncbi:aldehyde dehydrogenase family protein [Agrobacterium tumefaciens]|uniref:aldehyde dehydrogenase family protein n=1 Tax=Agrobacterium tumefaciens TaxID=358 RepID=UPI000556FB1F|nr:aldehyde dehydrogenase family protein [Agrobacterium tumefaciens]
MVKTSADTDIAYAACLVATLGELQKRRAQNNVVASILSGDTYRGLELAPRILAVVVNINTATVNDEAHVPMGGVRDSGWGRTGPDCINDFTDTIWINARHSANQAQYPF